MSNIMRKKINFDTLFDEFILEKKCSQKSPATIKFYKECYERFKRECDLSKLNQQTIYKWIEFLQDIGVTTPSINHYLRGIRAFFYYCMDKSFIDKFQISLLSCQEEKLKMVSDEDLSRLLVKPSGNSKFREYRTYTIICFIMATGARALTICNIKKEDIDWINKEITFRHLKNKSLAIIPLSKSLDSILKLYINTWEIKSEFLFPDYHGNQLSTNGLALGIRTYCKKRNCKSYGPHAFRHTFAMHWIKNNGSAFTLQKMLTHSDLTMTRKYVRLFGNDLKENFDSYSPLDSYIKTNRSGVIKRKTKT